MRLNSEKYTGIIAVDVCKFVSDGVLMSILYDIFVELVVEERMGVFEPCDCLH